MQLECTITGERYFLFAQEGADRWPLLAPGADVDAERRGMTRAAALRAALLAGFSTREAERAIAKAERGAGQKSDD